MQITSIKNYLNTNTIKFKNNNGDILDFIIITGKSGIGKTLLLKNIWNHFNRKEKTKIKCDVCTNKKTKTKYEVFPLNFLFAYNFTNIEIEISVVNYLVEDMNLNVKLDSIQYNENQFEIENKLIFKNKEGKKIPYHKLSNTEKTIYDLALVFCNEYDNIENSILLIDELKTTLTPQNQYDIVKMFKKMALLRNNQIIMVTNSPQIISSFKPENIFILYRNNYGNSLKDIKCDSAENLKIKTMGVEIHHIINSQIFNTALRESKTLELLDECFKLLYSCNELNNEKETLLCKNIQQLERNLDNTDKTLINLKRLYLKKKRNLL